MAVENQQTDILDSWTNAENAAFAKLCEATGMESGVNAFIGEVDDVCNSFYLYNDQVMNGGEVFYAPEQPNFVLPYTAVGIFDSRREIQRWAMRVIRALPARDFANIPLFRMRNTAVGRIKLTSRRFRNETVERLAWELELDFDLVIHVTDDFTGGA